MPPLVSILIPAYNAQEWIGDTIESALGESWPRKEIIVVDDGSTDQTLSIARRFASKTAAVVTQTNQGAAAARNRAFSMCQGDYIQWLDADDLLAPDKIAKQLEPAAEGCSKRHLLSSAWGSFIYRTSRAKFSPTPLWRDLSPIEWLVQKIGRDLSMQPLAWLVSRELTEAAGPWDTRLLGDDDGEYFCRVVRASDGVRFVPEARSFYRRATFSLSYIGRSDKKIEAQFLALQLCIAHARSLEDSRQVRTACLESLKKYLICFYPERPDIVKKMETLAASLGGQLESPRLPWKYAWIQKVLGWTAAKRTQMHYNQCKSAALRSWDKILFQLEKT
jgi:glycosyltransferase involved in cell wall biosynthesis